MGEAQMTQLQRQWSSLWWTKRLVYFLFMIRELSGVFVGAYSFFLIFFLYKLSQGPEGYASVMMLMKSPFSIALHVIALLFVLYHTVTWFNLTPQVTVLHIGEERVPSHIIAGAFFGGWLFISAVVVFVVLKL